MRDQTSRGQFNLFDAAHAPPAVAEPPQARRLNPDPGPLTGKMEGKSARRIASTRPYHLAPGPFRPVTPRPLPAVAPVVNPRAPRYGNVLEKGPHRYFLRHLEGDRHQLIDRSTGEAVDQGPWVNMWGLALRKNGIDFFAAAASVVGEWRYFEMMELREAKAHAAAGGIAVHHTGFPFRHWRFTAHLLAQDQEALLAAVRSVGADPKWIQYPGTDREHYDLMGGPLSRAMHLCGRPGHDPTAEEVDDG